ncbi:probable ATP-dependent RNA helicase pitchoune [Toxorhynchites rutilus septentrionalis]|uniref:probable ATP-dependent RNA helicase pitchoune n=1 Tax=Toxorhynchites rutilus septentrionalis TaxID=329112 RepID=UPI00247AD4C3|nr:probable ATP-dependent RNA helicase pitchoune [Toxorhynchites rutilus septentrionalis]
MGKNKQKRKQINGQNTVPQNGKGSIEDLEENFELEPELSKSEKMKEKKRKNKEAASQSAAGAFVKRPKYSDEEENGNSDAADSEEVENGHQEQLEVGSANAYEILLGNQEFEGLKGKVSENTLKAISAMGFTKMTEIQAKAIPPLLEGRDLIGSAKTGSGKTLAFLIPAVELIYKLQFKPRNGTGVIIISPTRELAMQIFGVLKELMAHQHHTYGLLMGGASRHTENEKLSKGLNIVVATPGRLLDHLKNTPNFLYKNLQCLVIDECDRILEIGFEEDMKQIISILPKKRQTMLFSATQTSRTEELSKLALKSEPIYVGVDDNKTEATVSGLEQGYIVCPSEKRLLVLFTFLKKNRKKKVMVFFSSCLSVKFHHELFNYIDLPVNSIHGKQKQAKRTSVFFQFCNAESGILLCTDVAARGLDIPAVDWIVQYDPPNDTKEYIHRVGRTARGENLCGHALLILRPEEVGFLRYLKQAKVPLNEFEFSWSKIADIQLQLENLLSKNYFLNQSGKLAFKSYVRAYEGHHMKDVFNVGNLDLAQVAKNFGFTQPPYVDFGKSFKIQNSERRAGNRGMGHFKTLNKEKPGMKFKHIKNRKELKKIEYE